MLKLKGSYNGSMVPIDDVITILQSFGYLQKVEPMKRVTNRSEKNYFNYSVF